MKLYSKRKSDYKIDYTKLIELVNNTWEYFFRNDYFVDKLKVTIQSNTREFDVNAAFTKDAKNLLTIALHFDPFPISEFAFDLGNDKVFDFVEFLYQHCSKPINGAWFDETTDTGWNYQEYRYKKYDEIEGKKEFLEKVNSYLPYYEKGYELLENGQVVLLTNDLQEIISQDIPKIEIEELAYIPSVVQNSILKFRNKEGDLIAIRDSLKNLADVNERLREFIKNKKLLNQTEIQLIFKICHDTANNFYIRHDNQKQLRDYDPVFLSMLFHIYLSTVHTAIRIVKESEVKSSSTL